MKIEEAQEISTKKHILPFIPFLYALKNEQSINVDSNRKIAEIISSSAWLEDDAKTYLLDHLQPYDALENVALEEWQNTLKDHELNLDEVTIKPLVSSLCLLEELSENESLRDELSSCLHQLNHEFESLQKPTIHAKSKGSTSPKAAEQQTIPSFNIEKLKALLQGEDAAIIEEIKQVLTSAEFDYLSPYTSVDRFREQVFKWCRSLADKGYGSLGYPKEFGGGGDIKGYFAAMDAVSYHDTSMVIKFGVQFGLWGMSVMHLGTEKHHKKYLRQIGTLELPGCFAMTETGHGSNVRGLETTATYDHASQTFTILSPNRQSGKEYIGNAALHGKMATVFAKLIVDEVDHGVNAFLVPLRDDAGNLVEGVEIEDNGHKIGLNGVDNGRIWFHNVVIEKDAMLDRYASIDDKGKFHSPITSDNRRFFTMLGTLVGGRIAIPRSALTVTKTGITTAIRFAQNRKQFGPENGPEIPILDYQSHQRRLLPLLANVFACHFALRYLSDRFFARTENEMQEIEALAAGMKAWVTWNNSQTLQECREAMGGKGYLSENFIGRLKSDTEIYTTFEGDNTVLMQLVAKSRLAEFKKDFADINFLGMFSYIAEKAKVTLAEKNPLAIRDTSSSHLLDYHFHLKAFQYRESSHIVSAARRFKHFLDTGDDTFTAFNKTQTHMIQVGHAYIERVIMEQFIAGIKKIEDRAIKNVMIQLCRLFALSQLEKHKGWYLESGYMDGMKTKAIRKLVNTLCLELRPEAMDLVESFDIPEKLLPELVRN
ncbi:MAG: acyl-CoA dehydrogenase [Bacteroidota bacterium]